VLGLLYYPYLVLGFRLMLPFLKTLLNRFADPEMILDLGYQEIQSELIRARQSLGKSLENQNDHNRAALRSQRQGLLRLEAAAGIPKLKS